MRVLPAKIHFGGVGAPSFEIAAFGERQDDREGKTLVKTAGNFDEATESGAPGPIRTGDPLLRRQMLYPAELRARRLL